MVQALALLARMLRVAARRSALLLQMWQQAKPLGQTIAQGSSVMMLALCCSLWQMERAVSKTACHNQPDPTTVL
jgi:hypothetical protein